MLSDGPARANPEATSTSLILSGSQNGVADDEPYGQKTVQDTSIDTTADALYSQSQVTPPATPNDPQESLRPGTFIPPVFHNFLRAFYPFQPALPVTESSVTLPLDEGDIVLVHSVHTNGWADGTQLATGSRGWLPTNFCEAYGPEEMRNLLKSLLTFWDLLRSTAVEESDIFQNQEFMKGIIAGVRYLLASLAPPPPPAFKRHMVTSQLMPNEQERTNCLSKESSLIQRSDGLRKCRKSLLSEVASLVKAAKRLQDLQRRGVQCSEDDLNEMVDQLILKAFKIVTKGGKFLDVRDDERRNRIPTPIGLVSTAPEEAEVPPTPPAAGSDVTIEGNPPNSARWSRRLSSLHFQPHANSYRISRGSFSQNNRHSFVMSNRVSLVPQPSQPDNLVSERLTKSSDQFITHLASFVGRLRMGSPRPDFEAAVRLCIASGHELLRIIDSVCNQSGTAPESLNAARVALKKRIDALLQSAREVLMNVETEDTDMIVPYDDVLQTAAAECVKAAGECVTKATVTMAKIGDFEIEPVKSHEEQADSPHDVVEDEARTPLAKAVDVVSVSGSASATDPLSPPARSAGSISLDKPLPRVPDENPISAEAVKENDLPDASEPVSAHGDMSGPSSPASSTHFSVSSLPKLATAIPPAKRQSMAGSYTNDLDFNPDFDVMTGSSAGSSTTYLSRDSQASMMSQTSTRATTPDLILAPRSQPSISELSAVGSFQTTEEGDDVECRLLERTYAHELVFNKEGQVTGGSLPALVERLTTHEATPDATFVSTFYLTFRLFCTPVTLTEALIDRFEYVGESPHMAAAVRLRVSNAFKGWLESHWRDKTDREALGLIIPFAETRLKAVLPSAGLRLLELARKVSGDGALVPRFVSSLGRANSTTNQLVPADLPLPNPNVSRGQMHLLHGWKIGNISPSILDFDPLELARQLTIKQMNVFCSIIPEELLNSQWMKNGGVDAPNVKAMSSLSTDLSNLVAETILFHTEIKKRAAVIKQWIKIAQQCLELNNYDGVMAIICSLNSSTINRLRKTWDIISIKRKETLQHLQEIVEPLQNNKVLRTRLQDHVPPCLPFLGMYLTDLTFVDIGNPATKQLSLGSDGDDDSTGGLTVVNFDKHTRTAKIIGELQRFQIPYRLSEVPELQDWMSAQIQRVHDGDQGNVQAYYRKSLLLEPRETMPRREGDPSNPMAASRPDRFAWMSRGEKPSASS